jgi:hypothetical protein
MAHDLLDPRSMPMDELVRCAYEYRYLRGRRELMRHELSVEDAGRLQELSLLWESAPDRGPEGLPPALRRRFARCDVRVPAILKIGERERPVLVVNVGGGGAVVEPAAALALRWGELVVLRVRLPSLGREYQFHAQARWSQDPSSGRTGRLALAFVGMPLELRFGPGRSALSAEAA